MSRPAKPMVFVTLPTGCFVSTSHKPTSGGYLNKHWGNQRTGDRYEELFHRLMWKLRRGPIPDGHEIDHVCQNRPCCNVEHLRCIPKAVHAADTSAFRALPRIAAAKAYHVRTKCTGAALAQYMGVAVSTAYRWMAMWAKERRVA